MPVYAVVVKAGTKEVVEVYHLTDPRYLEPGSRVEPQSHPVATEDELFAVIERLAAKYPGAEYEVMHGGAGSVEDLVEYSRTADYEYDNYK
jgi:hypothetical protein